MSGKHRFGVLPLSSQVNHVAVDVEHYPYSSLCYWIVIPYKLPALS